MYFNNSGLIAYTEKFKTLTHLPIPDIHRNKLLKVSGSFSALFITQPCTKFCLKAMRIAT